MFAAAFRGIPDAETIWIRKSLGLCDYVGCVECGSRLRRLDIDKVVRCAECDGEEFGGLRYGIPRQAE